MLDTASLTGRKIVVIGGRGFIGAHLVRALAEREKAHVVVVARSKWRNPWRDLENVKVFKSSGTAGLAEAVTGAHAVVNLAYDFLAPPSELLQEFDRLIVDCEAGGVGKVVQFSSIVVYDDWPNGNLSEASPSDGPGGSYKTTKRAMERRLAGSSLAHTILQPTIVYGAGSPQWTEKVFDRLRLGEIVLPSGDEGLCHAVHVDDLIDATIAAIRSTSSVGDRYIISGPEPVGWRTFYKGHADLLGKPAPRLESFPQTGSQLPLAAPRVAARSVRSFGALVRSIVPPNAIASIKRAVSRLRHGGRPIIYRPSPSDLVLLRARGSCSTALAQRDLDYRPKIDFETGMKMIAQSLRP